MGLADPDAGHVVLRLKIEDVPLADESIADKADADAVIRPEHAPIGRGRQCDGPRSGVQKVPPGKAVVNRISHLNSNLRIRDSRSRLPGLSGGTWPGECGSKCAHATSL